MARSASLCPGAAFLRASHLRADRRASQRHGGADFKAASRALADGQAGDVPRRRRSGVESRSWRRLCDGRRHRGAPRRQSSYTTQIGSDTFTVFRTGPSKSRLAFLSRLCGGTTLYVINDAALDYMSDHQLPQVAIGEFTDHKERISRGPRTRSGSSRRRPDRPRRHPRSCPDRQRRRAVGRDPPSRLLPDTVIVSDDAGQFRVGVHSLCWFHAERLVHKLVPANDSSATPSRSPSGFGGSMVP